MKIIRMEINAEAVIELLETIRDTIFSMEPKETALLTGGIALLERYKTKNAIIAEDHDSPSGILYAVCPRCKIAIDEGDFFCRHCGQSMKWE